jgi:hypothetical protein
MMPALPMVNMTIALPDELHAIMKSHKDIKWSEVARQGIVSRAIQLSTLSKNEQLALMDMAAANSRLTEKDVEEIGRKIKRDIARAHGLRV